MKQNRIVLTAIGLLGLFNAGVKADNPIVQTNYTADPAPMVHNGTVYLYTTHDEDKTVRNFFTMNDWKCYSTTDMVNWTDRGTIFSYKDLSWARGDAWAGQCVFRNGKYYFYIPVNQKNGGNAIGVVVADSPTGPFKDVLGAPLLSGYGYIDPSVFIDDDGQAYLYWGNPHLWYVKLNADMISYDKTTGVVAVPMTEESFKLRTYNAHKTFAWASSIDGNASHSVKGPNNQYYWFVGATDKATGKKSIALGVGKTALGPFTDVLGKPFITEHCDGAALNPTIITDNDRQQYLTWSNGEWCVKLNADMLSYDPTTGVSAVPAEKKNTFVSKIKGTLNSTEKRATTYEEGPWLFKRNSRYYLLYPAGGVPEHLAYSTSSSPTGPWVYGDTIMKVIEKNGAFTNHPGYIEYKGKSFLFYHNAGLPGGGGFKRSVCVEPFTFNADGTIPRIASTSQGVKVGVSTLNPFVRTEAETMAWGEGVETALDSLTGMYLTDVTDGDYIKLVGVDFAKGATRFEAMLKAASGASVEIRLDKADGTLAGTLAVKPSTAWSLQSAKLSKLTGVHDLYLVFKGAATTQLRMDFWQFKR